LKEFRGKEKGLKTYLVWILFHLTSCFPLSISWRGGLKGEVERLFLFFGISISTNWEKKVWRRADIKVFFAI